ncbi:MAG: hypothetical protein GY845_25610 [Planctomycetes bacterium]|nr:hypothetical protein [Planctomycetota bacterium]
MPKPKKKHTRIIGGTVKFLSLCPKGANRIQAVYKSEDGDEEICIATVAKDMTEQGEITAIVYAPEFRDSQGDIASADAIKSMQREFAKTGGNIDINHNEVSYDKDDVFVAENFIVDKGDSRFADLKDYDGNQVDVDGSWAVVLKVDNPELRKLYREGGWQGISLGGLVVKTQETDKEADQSTDSVFKEFVSKFTNWLKTDKSNEEPDMNDEQIIARIDEAVAKALKGLTVENGVKTGESEIKNRYTDGVDNPTMASVREELEANAAKSAEGAKEDAVAIPELEVAKAYTLAKRIYDLAHKVDADDPDAVNAFLAKKARIEADKEDEKSMLWRSAMKTCQTAVKKEVKKAEQDDVPKGDKQLLEIVAKRFPDKKD